MMIQFQDPSLGLTYYILIIFIYGHISSKKSVLGQYFSLYTRNYETFRPLYCYPPLLIKVLPVQVNNCSAEGTFHAQRVVDLQCAYSWATIQWSFEAERAGIPSLLLKYLIKLWLMHNDCVTDCPTTSVPIIGYQYYEMTTDRLQLEDIKKENNWIIPAFVYI